MELNKCDAGKRYIIQKIQTGDEIAGRLEALGVTGGTAVTVQSRKRSGSMIMKVRGTRLALGNGITEKILVCEEEKIKKVLDKEKKSRIGTTEKPERKLWK
ncbi:MAG: ferrous iron transport protein A [Enterocloster sp.]